MTKDNFFPPPAEALAPARVPALAGISARRLLWLVLVAALTAHQAWPAAIIGSPTHPRLSAKARHRSTVEPVPVSVRRGAASRAGAKSRGYGKPAANSRTVAMRGRRPSRNPRLADAHLSRRDNTAARALPAAAAFPTHLSRRQRRAMRRREQIAASHSIEKIQPAIPPPPDPKLFAQDQQVAASAPQRIESFRDRLAGFLLAPLRGSHESLVRQNQRAAQDGLSRVQDDDDITRQVAARTLVALPAQPGLRVDERLPANRRFTRPWTALFLANLARAHDERFGVPLQVNSAVRTVEFQKHLIHVNGNAAPADGDNASSHLMGGTVDLAKKGMSPQQVQWMRAYLMPLEQAGKIDVEEEFQQACFHIAVYKSYMPQLPQKLVASDAAHIRVPGSQHPQEN